MAHQFVAVRFQADVDAGFVQQGGVEGDGVVGLDLVGPPVGEGAATWPRGRRSPAAIL